MAGGSSTGEPTSSGFTETGDTALEATNISFFLPDNGMTSSSDDLSGITPGSVGDGTYENPYIGMTQANVDDGNRQSNRLFYVNSGTYNAVYGSAEYQGNDFIQLNNDTVLGRQNYNANPFVQMAQGDNRPLILFTEGGFLVPGLDSSDTISSLRLQGQNPDGSDGRTTGIFIDHEGVANNLAVTVDNVQVESVLVTELNG